MGKHETFTEGETRVEAVLRRRMNNIERWLAREAPDTAGQKHLDAGSPERAYWHRGYRMALRDVLALLRRHRSAH